MAPVLPFWYRDRMNASPDGPNCFATVYATARAIALAALTEPAPDWLTIVRQSHALADQAWAAALTLEADLPACAPGCGWCCHQPVEAAPVEILAIAESLRAAPVWHDPLATWRGGRICPFLVEGRCVIHPLRPLKCRGLFQPDPRWCMATFAKCDPPPGGAPIRHRPLAFPRRLCDSVIAGLLTPLHQAGLDCDAYSFAPALRAALDRSDALAAWAGGERIFPASARLHGWIAPN